MIVLKTQADRRAKYIENCQIFLYLLAMRIRKSISVLVLAVYAIVMAHNFIPHHHHSQITEDTHHCEHSGHHPHDDHQHEKNGDCCVDHSNDCDEMLHCSFEEETILAKSIDLSELFVPSTEIVYSDIEETKFSYVSIYIHIPIKDAHCRDVQFRGPPYFS